MGFSKHESVDSNPDHTDETRGHSPDGTLKYPLFIA